MSEAERQPSSDSSIQPQSIDPPEQTGGGSGATTESNDPFEDYYGGVAIDPPDNSGTGNW